VNIESCSEGTRQSGPLLQGFRVEDRCGCPLGVIRHGSLSADCLFRKAERGSL
jgi:hypothetical protein